MHEIDLTLGEPEMGLPSFVRDAVIRYLDEGNAQPYPPRAGLPALRRAIAADEQARGRAVDPEQVVVTAGATQALWVALLSARARDTAVLYPVPGFPHYPKILAAMAAPALGYPVDEAGHPSLLETAEHAPSSVGAVVRNYPHNPTGALAQPEWDRSFEELTRRDALLVSDEVYSGLTFAPGPVFPLEVSDRVVVVGSFSKRFGLAGLRLGYVLAPHALARTLADAVWTISMGVATTAQMAGLAALSLGTDFYEARRQDLLARRDRAVDALREAGLGVRSPEGTCFVWVRVPSRLGSAEVAAARLWHEHRVRVLAGPVFGSTTANDRLRLSFGVAAETLDDALLRLRTWASSGAQRPTEDLEERVPTPDR